ncbi:hypothetical protein ALC60_10921, partial [Trachymyrmex zeteki]
DLPERRSKTIAAVTATSQEFDIFNRYSMFTRLIRVVAYIYRFARNSRKAKTKTQDMHAPSTTKKHIISPITPEEQNQVIIHLLRIIQTIYFTAEIRSLDKGEAINKNSPLLKLNPFIDGSGVLRVGGRLKEATLPYSSKYPILLPRNHPFSRLVRHEHKKTVYNLYKLINNVDFVKIMENVRNHVDVRLVMRWGERYGAEAMITKPNFHSRSVFFFFRERGRDGNA